MSNEKGWNFSKTYIDNIGALDSVSEYLKILNAKEIKVDFFSLSEDIINNSSAKINSDVKNRSVFLPDNGSGYKYH